MTKPVTYISLGPTCLPSEILKATGLRRCTYGFDWFRSGYIHLSFLLENPLDQFLLQHVNSPNIPLEQICDPTILPSKTSEVRHMSNMYGFPYLYNPHRNLQLSSTRDYFYRCFYRLRTILFDDNIYKLFFLADYVNKPYSTYLHSPPEIFDALTELLRANGVQNFKITILRLLLDPLVDESHISSYTHALPIDLLLDTHNTYAATCRINPLNDHPLLRAITYKSIGRQIFSDHLDMSIIAWRGCNYSSVS